MLWLTVSVLLFCRGARAATAMFAGVDSFEGSAALLACIFTMPFPLFYKVNECPYVAPHANYVKEDEEQTDDKHDRCVAHAEKTYREEETTCRHNEN